MEKVKLTKEQAKAIEYALQEVDEYKGNPDKLLRHASMKNVYFRNELHLLNSIDTVNLAKALYIGYEVEPKFEVGDWAVWRSAKGVDVVKQIEKVEGYRIWADWLDEGSLLFAPSDEIRHATPEEVETEKERRWWAKHGREVWELKDGDVLLNRDNELCEVTRENNLNVFINGTPRQRSAVGYGFKVVCFVEDRKDI